MTDTEKANEIATNNLDRCFGNTQMYGATCALEMCAWKEEQMIEIVCNFLKTHNRGQLCNQIIKAMKGE